MVGTGTAEATLDSVGTITPVNQAALNFNVSGTVEAVDVAVGQSVTAGQTLASLDVAPLNAAVTSARPRWPRPRPHLASAEASETAATTTAATDHHGDHDRPRSATPTGQPGEPTDRQAAGRAGGGADPGGHGHRPGHRRPGHGHDAVRSRNDGRHGIHPHHHHDADRTGIADHHDHRTGRRFRSRRGRPRAPRPWARPRRPRPR